MSVTQQIKRLLNQVPDRAKPQVIDFLRTLATTAKAKKKATKNPARQGTAAQASFGMIKADTETVRQVLTEDLYGLQ